MTTDLQIVDRPTDFATTREVWATQMTNAALNTLNDRLTDYRLSYLNRSIEFNAADHYTAALFALNTAKAELTAIEERMNDGVLAAHSADRDTDALPTGPDLGGDGSSVTPDREEGSAPLDLRGREAILTWAPDVMTGPQFLRYPASDGDPEPDPPAVA